MNRQRRPASAAPKPRFGMLIYPDLGVTRDYLKQKEVRWKGKPSGPPSGWRRDDLLRGYVKSQKLLRLRDGQIDDLAGRLERTELDKKRIAGDFAAMKSRLADVEKELEEARRLNSALSARALEIEVRGRGRARKDGRGAAAAAAAGRGKGGGSKGGKGKAAKRGGAGAAFTPLSHQRKGGPRPGEEGIPTVSEFLSSSGRPADEAYEIDQKACPVTGAPLSARPVGSVGQTVIDVEITVAKIETTKQRRWCSACKTIHTARSPIALPNSRFTVRTDVFLAALKVNGMAYARSRALASSFLGIRIDENDLVRAMHRVAKALGPLYEEFARQIRTASAVNVDESRWWVSGKGAWLWDFVTRWTVFIVAETSRSGEVPRRHLEGFKGTVGKDSFGATNGIGSAEQVCLQHYSREIGRTLDLKNPGDEFRRRMAPTLIRILGDARRADKYKSKKRRLECKKRLEARVGRMARADWTEPNCRRFAKRLRRERGKMFTFLAVDEIKWHNNDAERPFRPSASIRKVSGGSRSMEGARDHAVLHSVNQTCRARKMDFYGSVVRHLAGNAIVKRVKPSGGGGAAGAGRGTPRRGGARRPAWTMPCGPSVGDLMAPPPPPPPKAPPPKAPKSKRKRPPPEPPPRRRRQGQGSR